jgi:hypothetical protein
MYPSPLPKALDQMLSPGPFPGIPLANGQDVASLWQRSLDPVFDPDFETISKPGDYIFHRGTFPGEQPENSSFGGIEFIMARYDEGWRPVGNAAL